MSDEERAEFNIDVKSINWREAELNFIFGIRRFFLKEDILAPEAKFNQILPKAQIAWFEDIRLSASAAN